MVRGMAKLGQQLKTQAEEREMVEIGKLPRTQRKRYKLEVKRAGVRAEHEYQRRKKKAQTTETKIKGMTFSEYKTFYPTVKERWLKDLLQTPTQIEEERKVEIKTQITRVQDRVKLFETRKINLGKSKANDRSRLSDKKDRYSSSEYFRKKMKIEDDYDEDIADVMGNLKGLQEGLALLNSGKLVEYSVINSYADDIGDYYEDKERARNEGKIDATVQRYEIRTLVEKGYKPLLIEKFEKDVLKSAELTFFHAGEQKYATIKPIQLQTQKVSQLPTSELGRIKVPMQYVFGGKTFNIIPTAQLRKTPSGKLTTALTGKLGVTEKEFRRDFTSPTGLSAKDSAWILQEAELPQVELPKVDAQTDVMKQVDVNAIVDTATSPVKKKRKFGLATAMTIFGVNIPKVVTKTNPSLPPKADDKLTSVTVKQPIFEKPFFRESAKFVGKTFTAKNDY